MRRSYISPEYHINLVNGSFNMLEESNFFSAKMLEIDQTIIIDNIDILWYQMINGEQLDVSIESTLQPLSYSPSKDKFNNHTLNYDRIFATNNNKNSKWLFNINLETILINYLYATLKKWRTFDGLKNNMTLYNDVNVALTEYIKKNVLNRYKYKRMDLFIEQIPITENNRIKYGNNWNINLNNNTIVKNYQTNLNDNNRKLTATYIQYDSDKYVFNYYFNIIFQRI